MRYTLIMKADSVLDASRNGHRVVKQMLAEGWKVLKKDGVAEIDDSFRKPMGKYDSGYKDFAIKFEKDGTVAELQLLQQNMLKAKQGEGHKLYEDEQGLKKSIKRLKSEDKNTATKEKHLLRVRQQMQRLYGGAYRRDNPHFHASYSTEARADSSSRSALRTAQDAPKAASSSLVQPEDSASSTDSKRPEALTPRATASSKESPASSKSAASSSGSIESVTGAGADVAMTETSKGESQSTQTSTQSVAQKKPKETSKSGRKAPNPSEPVVPDGRKVYSTVAFHGGKSAIEQFDMEHIGTGSGRATEGHGINFSDKQGLAGQHARGRDNTPGFIHEVELKDGPWLAREWGWDDQHKKVQAAFKEQGIGPEQWAEDGDEGGVTYGRLAARIYLDNAATTPLDPRVAGAMEPYAQDRFGNPSSLHQTGREARLAVDHARQQVADLIHAEAGEIVFTASGTESDNTALKGVVDALGTHNCHVVTSAIEHPAVLESCRWLEQRGVKVSRLPVDGEGIVDPDVLSRLFQPTTCLVSVMAANNVVGTLQPIGELARIAHEHGALFHTDAVQAAGRVPIDVSREAFDLVSLSAHKMHGPKGVGALWMRKGTPFEPLIHGGGQERGMRSATENVAGIVGFGRAAALAREMMSAEAARLVRLRDRLIDGITDFFPQAYLIGHRFRRLPGHVCIGFDGQEGEAIKMLLALDEAGIAVSSGSACGAHHAGEPSSVLLAMGLDPVRARGSLRLTLGRFNMESDIDQTLQVLSEIVPSLRRTAV